MDKAEVSEIEALTKLTQLSFEEIMDDEKAEEMDSLIEEVIEYEEEYVILE